MFHLAAYRSTMAIGAAYANVSLIVGSGDIVQNNSYFTNRDLDLLGAFGFGTGMSAVRIQTPTLLQVAPTNLRPINIATTPGNNPNIVDYSQNPIRLNKSEGVQVQSTNTDAGTQAHTVGVFLGVPGTYQMARGVRRTIRATGTTTLVPNSWTTVSLTYEVALPEGEYEIQNIEVMSATGYFARILNVDQYYRPGVTVVASEGSRQPAALLDRHFGPFGRFTTLALPNIEMLATAGDTAETVYFDLVKVR